MATEEIHEEFYNFLMENERGWLMSRVRTDIRFPMF